MGFGAVAERRAPPTLLCVLRLDRDQVKKAGDAAAQGADAVIVTGLDAGKLGDVLKKLGDVPVGLRLEDAQRATVEAAREAGADFVVLDEKSSAETILEEKAGLVLLVGGEESDAELRALGGLSLDALEVAPFAEPLTIRRLVQLRRLSSLSQTPLLVEGNPGIGPSRLEALREAGVTGIILDGRSADKLAALREAVLSLPPRGRRREARTDALLPSLIGVPEAEEEEPDYE